MNASTTFKPQYNIASFLFALIAVIGFLLIALGIAGAITFAIEPRWLYDWVSEMPHPWVGMAISGAGVVITANAQLGSAILDTANNTAETLQLLEVQN